MRNSLYLKETGSTNNSLWSLLREKKLPEGFIVYTDFQAMGRGQSNNVWESEKGNNILFSILLKPVHIEISEHFLLSQLVSIAVKKTLDQYTGNISIKWPNDIYWNNRKIVGILIENSLQSNVVKETVAGIGININQKIFQSDALNPVSLFQITGKKYARKPILEHIRKNIMDIYLTWNQEEIRSTYMKMLYRNTGFHLFSDTESVFEARIKSIQPDGRMDLKLKTGVCRSFYFKEVRFVE